MENVSYQADFFSGLGWAFVKHTILQRHSTMHRDFLFTIIILSGAKITSPFSNSYFSALP